MKQEWTKRWKQFLSGSGLKTLVFKALNLNFLNSLLPLATSLLIFIAFDRSLQGCYRTLLALLAICELFLSGLDGSILRFWSSQEVPKEDKQAIIQLVFFIKSGTMLLFLGSAFFLQQFPSVERFLLSEEALAIGYQPYFYLALGFTFLSSLTLTVSKCFIASRLFGYIFRLTLIREFLTVLVVLFLITLNYSFLSVLIAQFLIYLGLLFFNIRYAWKQKEFFYLHTQKYPISTYQRIYQNYLRNYSLPISFTSVLTYAKNNLPLVLLGKSKLHVVADYHFLRNTFLKIHKLSSGYLAYLLPKFVEMYEKDPRHFSRRFNQLFWASQLFRLMIWIAVCFFGIPFLLLFKMDSSYQFILILFSLELMAADIATFNAEVIHLKTDTRSLFYASFLRAMIEVPCILVLTQKLGGVGASVTLLISRLVECGVLLRYASPLKVLTHQRKIFVLLWIFTLFYLYLHRGKFGF